MFSLAVVLADFRSWLFTVGMLLVIPVIGSAQEDSTKNKNMAPVGLENPMKRGNAAPGKNSRSQRLAKPMFQSEAYFYASMKLSIEDLATYAFASEGEADDYETKEGLILDFGYGKQLNKYFGMEGGFEAYFLNPMQVIYDHEQDSGYDVLDVKSGAYSLQLKPYFHLDLGEQANLRIGTGLIYQQLHSTGKYYPNSEQEGAGAASNVLKSSYRSRILLNYEPFTAVDFRLNEKWVVSFDLTYVRINWNKSLRGLRFQNQPGLQLPDHRTATVFLGARVAFK
jgi:hypothetical protein